MRKISAIAISLLLFLSQVPFVVFAEEFPIEATVPDEIVEEIIISEEYSEEPVPEPLPEPIPEPVVPPLVVINEILADPLEDDGENEFIEIYNAGSEAVDLRDWQLDDAKEDDGSYFFLNDELDYVLHPDAYLVLFRPETDITLNNDTDSVTLFDTDGNEIDSYEFDSPGSGKSLGRSPENSEDWITFKMPTPGFVNVIEANEVPVAVIDIQQDTDKMKLNVTGANSYDPDGDALSFFWEFEEGVFDERENPLIYEYLMPGEKLVRLTVTDFFGDIGESEIVFIASDGSGDEEPDPDPNPDPEPEPIPEPGELPLVFINEILADPVESDSENEFIEIYNAGGEAIDLRGWQLDDARLDDGLYIFSNDELDYILDTGGYLVLFRPETGITLNNDIEIVTLFDPDGNQVDSFEFESQGSGRSWGRSPENSEEWLVFKTPTPGLMNVIEPNNPPVAVIEMQKSGYMKLNVTGAGSFDPDGDKLSFLWEFEEGIFDERENPLIYEYLMPGEKIIRFTVTDEYGDSGEAEISFMATQRSSGGGITIKSYPVYSLINEVMPSPDGKDSENEWVELYNDNSFEIDLSGWYLDDAEGKSSPFKIPEGTFISPNSYTVFSEPDLGLSFKNSEDVVRLLDPNKDVSQIIEYFEAKEDWSFAKGAFNVYEWTPLFTPGSRNDFPPPPKTYEYGSVIFESVLPNPEGTDSGNEKVTLSNKISEDISLMGWAMSDASGAIKGLPELMLGAQGSVTMLSSEFKLSLNNSNESLSLFDPTGKLIDEIKWRSSASGRWLFNPNSLKSGLQAEVIRVVDGDTVIVKYDDKKLTVRLIGIDTPETVHPFKPIEYYGKQASAFLSNTLSNQIVRLEFDENKIDKYGRVLAYIYLGDEMINETILSEGYGYAYTRFPFRFLDEFVALEEAARETGIGLWQNLKVMNLIDEIIAEELLLEDEELLEDDLLLLLEEELVEEELLAEEENDVMMPDCSSDFLKIDSFLPNPQKGEAVEYIRLINIGSEKVCLHGWILDDVIEKGSKPFSIRGGAIAAGGVRTFRKMETKLALNNKDDCVNLIAPDGLVADQICYEKTHKNEIFTYVGGDWVPKPRAKKKSKKTTKSIRHSFKRDFISYQSDLPTVSYIGVVSVIDEEAEVMVMELNTGDKVDISYASSPVNMAVAKELINFSDPVRVQVYESDDSRNLLTIEPVREELELSPKSDDGGQRTWIILLFGMSLLVFSPFINKVCPNILQKFHN